MKISVKLKKYVIWGLSGLILIFIILGLSGTFSSTGVAHPTLDILPAVAVEDYYTSYLSTYAQAITDSDEVHIISAPDFVLPLGDHLSDDLTYYEWIDDSTISLQVSVGTSGLYHIFVDYMSQTDSHMPISLSVQLNGEAYAPYYEASQVTLNTLWKESTEELGTDRYGNDVSVMQEVVEEWQYVSLKDARRLYPDGLMFYLPEGENQIQIEKLSGELLLREIKIQAKTEYITYENYLNSQAATSATGLVRLEAEEAYYKNSSTIGRGVSRDPLVLPFSMTKLKLNVLGADSFDISGDAVTWLAEVEQPGYYALTLKVKQTMQNTTVYRSLYINGELPFLEAQVLPISYDRGWQNLTLSNTENEPYLFYLEPGDKITLEVNSSMFTTVVDRLRIISNEMSQLGLDITKLTRNNTDQGIDWDMILYFPNLETELADWITELNLITSSLSSMYGFDKDAQVVQDIQAAISKIESIAADINELPRRLTLLSTGSSSAVQLLSSQIDSILKQPMLLDSIFIHTLDQELPKANGKGWDSFKISFGRFFLSFFDTSYTEKATADELEVWVNRSRQYVDLLQKITDDQFTTETGIKVKISLISDDSKLLLANSADQQPDAALGISAWIPNEYGMRGMLYDMTQADGFSDVISVFNPEQLIPMVYDGKLYGLPETENFFVLFYRKDILDQLDLTVPNTWDDVLNMLPVLRRYGMSFYIPLSNSSSLKSFDATGPFINQFEGEIYAPDGLSAALDNENTIEAMTFMTDLFREYSMPYQVASFFNSFRYSSIPIGIGDFGMYLQLMNAASDISGLWNIALVPGIEHEVYNTDTDQMETVVNRSMSGAQQASVIFEKSDKKEEAWSFLSWWMSTDTQVMFSNTLLNTLGTRYLWNSANLEAFEQFSWNEEHKAIILEQWTHLKEIPKIPGSYIIEREISNTWNSVVYDDSNLRSTVSDALIKINKELARKLKEFGYLDDKGNVIKPFILPTRELIESWYPHD
ncbi:MAG: extracellular solute-binding protein [Firmicutes bacterium]|nr:extracellular solute-binding protein [Bacillota bacterium]